VNEMSLDDNKNHNYAIILGTTTTANKKYKKSMIPNDYDCTPNIGVDIRVDTTMQSKRHSKDIQQDDETTLRSFAWKGCLGRMKDSYQMMCDKTQSSDNNTSTLEKGVELDLDTSAFLDNDGQRKYWSISGLMRWVISHGRFNILGTSPNSPQQSQLPTYATNIQDLDVNLYHGFSMGSRSITGVLQILTIRLQLTGVQGNKPLSKTQRMDTNSSPLAHASNKLWIFFARHYDILKFHLNRKASSWRQQSMIDSEATAYGRLHQHHNRDRIYETSCRHGRYSSSRWGVTTFQKEFENLNILSNHETVIRQLRVEVRHGIDTYFNMNAGRTKG
jgi:hypothetical protein